MRCDELHLWYLGQPETPLPIGTLRLQANGKGVSLLYRSEWLSGGFALSEDLPLVDLEHLAPGRLGVDAPRAVGAIDDARPDRWGEKVIRYLDKPHRLSLMEYLYFAGDDRFGALGVSTSGSEYRPRPGGPLPRLGQAQALSEAVARVEALEPISAVEARIIRAGGSLGGAKPKALIDIDGDPWIVKFFNGEPIDTPLVEHASMTLASRAGITVAQTRLLRLTTGHALAVRRFDRVQGRRIHSISAGTAIRAATPRDTEAELGYPGLARVLRRVGAPTRETPRPDAVELFRRMTFNILIDNTDDHEKNHALLVPSPFDHGRMELAPAYDVLPTNSGQGFQEFICGARGRESTLDNAMSHCDAFGLQPDEAAREVAAVIAVVAGWKEHFSSTGVTPRDIDNLVQRIDGPDLLAQRTGFEPARWRARGRAGKRKSPFQRAR